MIFERIDGDVKAVLNGTALAVGDSIEDSHWPLVFVVGVGKVVFRVDPNCTVERIGKAVSVEEVVAAEPIPVIGVIILLE